MNLDILVLEDLSRKKLNVEKLIIRVNMMVNSKIFIQCDVIPDNGLGLLYSRNLLIEVSEYREKQFEKLGI